jgi:hypothetical protein
MKLIPAPEKFGPFTQLLCPATVKGFLAHSKGQPKLIGYPLQVGKKRGDVDATAGKKLF